MCTVHQRFQATCFDYGEVVHQPRYLWHDFFRQGQHMFVNSLELLRYIMIVERMSISMESVLGVSWLANCKLFVFLTRLELQEIVMTIERLVICPDSVPTKRLLVKQLTQISLIELWNLWLEVVHSMLILVIQTLSLGLTHSGLYSFGYFRTMTLNSIDIGII